MSSRVYFARVCLALTMALAMALPAGAQFLYGPGRDNGRPEKDQGPALTEREKAVHVLNRMAFGPRPGQVERVMEMGVENWMRQQLKPRSIDDSFANSFAKELYPSVGLSNGNILRIFRKDYTPYKDRGNPTRREAQLRRQEVAERNRLRYQVRNELRNAVYHRALYSERQFEEVIVGFWREHFSIDQGKDDVAYFANNWEADVLRRHAFGKFEDMLMASARHPAMLVYLDNIASQRPLTERERSLIDRFGDRKNIPRSVLALQRHRGLNENYARELMELHTLGVDRKYTQQDVTELSRVLTGWTADWGEGAINNEDRRGREQLATYGFKFNREFHDNRDKVIFGTRLRGGGEDQGIEVIRALARHKYTAEFISRKLCTYLLRDKPSEAMVQRVAKVYQRTKGDLPKVYEAILFSRDFFYRQNHRVKFKTPFEYVVSALRATGAEVDTFEEIDRALTLMGQTTYGCPDPTGWYDTAEAWLDPGVLVYRWTFALDLAGNQMSGVQVPDALLANLPADQMKTKLENAIVPSGLTERTGRIIDQTLGRTTNASEMLAVMLGSPDFQQQ